MRTQKDRTGQYRRRRAVLILCLGGVAWLLLYVTGQAGTWQTALVGGLAAVLLLANVLNGAGSSGDPHGARSADLAANEESWPEPPVDLPSAGRRPNAVADEYNDLSGRWPVRPGASGRKQPDGRSGPAAQAKSETRPGRVPLLEVEAEHVSKMPPPVPPPLYGRPGSRPIVAGMEGTVGQGRRSADAEVAATAAVDAPAAELPPPAQPNAPAATAAPGEAPAETLAFAASPAQGTSPAPASPSLSLYPEQPVARPVSSLPEPAAQPPAPVPPPRPYELPPLELLPLSASERGLSDDEILERACLLEQTLASFGVEAKVVDFAFGPAVTRYELQPGPGVRVNKFTALADDLALALAAVDVRVEAPIPGKSAVGIEVPNKERLAVPLREVLQSPMFQESPSRLTVAFGKDNSGHPVVGDLARMPHLLIAGSTGSGKSVCMNSIICSLLYKARPDQVKMLMIDPKMVELSIYNGIPHLTAPVITDVRKAAGYLKGAVKEMESRYELFASLGVRNIEHYNQLVQEDPGPDPEHPRKPLPYIVIFIDELADLMMVAPADVEDSICRLAQMARACGMHLVIATQSPRVDVITGLIKANVPSRIAFAVSSQVDSRVILDSAGAERLLGRGDMLYHPSGLSKPLRAQGAFIDESSVEELIRFVKAQGEPEYTAQEVAIENGTRRGQKGGPDEGQPMSAVDEALPEAARIIIEHGQASVSILQRRLRCNYTKASRLIDMLEEIGFIGPHQGSRPREVLASMARWQELFGTSGKQAGDANACDDD